MATKVHCDLCDRQAHIAGPYYSKVGDTEIKISWSAAGQDVCVYCAIDAFKRLDDRQPARAMRGELGAPFVSVGSHGGDVLDEKTGAIGRYIDTNTAYFVVHPWTGEWIKTNYFDPDMLLQPPGWQVVPLRLTEQQIDTVNIRISKKFVLGSRTYLEVFWDEILLLLRSK